MIANGHALIDQKTPEQLLSAVMTPLAGQSAKVTVEVLMGVMGTCLNAIASQMEDKAQAQTLVDEILADIRDRALAAPQLIKLDAKAYANLQ